MSPVTATALALIRFDLRRYLVGGLLWMPAGVLPLGGGLVLQQVFDHLAADRVPLLLCAAFAGIELVRGLTIVVAWTYGDYWWSAAAALLRGNVLRSVLIGGGRAPRSSGEALARLRDDVSTVVEFVDESVPLAGAALFGVAALAIMSSVDPVVTLVLVLPTVAVGLIGRLMNRRIGRLHRRAAVLGAAVSVRRLTELMGPGEDLSRDGGVRLDRDHPAVLPPARHDPLRVLRARGLTTARGLHGVDLEIERGSFTVVTGAVGAGKTTLVRALLGLEPLTAGTIRWNGAPVADPGAFMVPGRVAYAGQAPRLFSASLRENLLLGGSAEGLERAVRLAAFDLDLARMPGGLDAVVGSRGVRLSGGQAQRATAARALVRSPDLLVVDGLSSALDVETERLLWERISGVTTLLVVSHRPAVLERADRVVVLDRGRVAGRGPLAELLETCPEMRRLWSLGPLDEPGSSAVP
ncbi:hlyB/MsbA family ABC transporter [Planomonospora sphaerica]|uniref:HlyB/MsbA family ABC transporter n=1 Tax=Planomonospora sphaerica TaxID=161355 RepID=A0A161LNP7_9ACTN|nr:ABC transporter ATP-binding protein [Planomonospora sphaerica]GAT69385.1 hlyB/MsbA family ABC transporter [Planomonospora sphaerica]